MEEDDIDVEAMSDQDSDVSGFDANKFHEEPLRNQTQFSNKLITPGTLEIIKAIYKRYQLDPNGDNEGEKEKLNDRVHNIVLGFGMVTRDYPLSYLDKPKNKNSYEYISFGHGFMSSLVVNGQLFPALFVSLLISGELNLTRGQDFAQQKILGTTRKEQRYEYPTQKPGVLGRFRGRG